ncbi:hypothetical protein LCGC14_2985620, partial [marine sediment metagenome]
MVGSRTKDKSWMFESDNILVNTIALGTISSKRLLPQAIEKLNQLLIDAIKQLDEAHLKR